ncbi:hypothetical protein [uncultured Thomasclavelia sp.]|uniref:hypothetical protein n=1 Tax=uncultured Thomasclavelia sp. TaxID=3025759 RepID=UPI0025DE4D6B|nr:hypothetical protein [uncultured Thomasclavelia sp.]
MKWTTNNDYQAVSSYKKVLKNVYSCACGSACGAGEDEKPEETPSACGSACGAGE